MNKIKVCFFALFVAFFSCTIAQAAQTIVTHETEKYFYKDGFMEKFDGQYEYTYLVDLEHGIVTRTRIYDYQTKKITPDETAYHVEKELNSYPTQSPRYTLPPMIKATAQTGPDDVELLVIEEDYAHTALSSGRQLVISRAKRLK